jgi:putative GTP pyrophosphokinase
MEVQEDYSQWYDNNKELYDSLRQAVDKVVQDRLDSQGLMKGSDYVFIESRLKKKDKFIKKMNNVDAEGKRKYANPKEITDIAGIRVVVYILPDLEPISAVVKRFFDIDLKRSVDKFKQLGESQVGIRSRNYIGKLDKNIIKENPEYAKFKELDFEIQVNTLLDYAWSVIEHDRNYMTASPKELPDGSLVPRRFKLLAGDLELVDHQFEQLSKETDAYAKPIPSKILKGELEIEISPYALRQFFTIKFGDVPFFTPYFGLVDDDMSELKSFGIATLSQLNKIIRPDFKQRYVKVLKDKLGLNDQINFSALLLDILILYYGSSYFKKATRKGYLMTLENYRYSVLEEFGVKVTLPDNWEWQCK